MYPDIESKAPPARYGHLALQVDSMDRLSMWVGGQIFDIIVFGTSPQSYQPFLSDLLAQTQHSKNILTAFTVFFLSIGCRGLSST